MLLLHYLFQSFFSSSPNIFSLSPYHLIHTSYMHAHICGALLLDIIVVCCCFNFHIPFFILFRKNTPTTKKKKGQAKRNKNLLHEYGVCVSAYVSMEQEKGMWGMKGVVCEEYYFSHFPFFFVFSIFSHRKKGAQNIYNFFMFYILFLCVYS